MKHLSLANPSFIYLEHSFKEWLTTIGYADTTIKRWPVYVREFLHYLETKHMTQITQVTPSITYRFIHHIKHRKSTATGTALSNNSINAITNAVNAFANYLNTTDKHTLDISPKLLAQNTLERCVLSKEDIHQLYQATFMPHRENSTAIGQRDRAIIALFYGCGLRKDEGRNLNLFDVDLHKRLVFIRRAKGNKQRYVPIAAKHAQDLQNYIEYGRNWFLQDNATYRSLKKATEPVEVKHSTLKTDTEAFLINIFGTRLCDYGHILNRLNTQAGLLVNLTTHTLRHSIATHLLQSGMKLEDIAKFLGHASLESTQIYTHLLNPIPIDN